jgi:hypothetical protein
LLGAVPVQDSVDVPDPPEMIVALRLQERLVELVVTVRVTVPVKPFSVAMVIVELPVAPALTVTLVGLAEMEKSGAAVTW